MTLTKSFRTGLVVAVASASACLPAAADYRSGSHTQRAEVLRVDPIVETVEVEVPREVCRNERVRDTSGYAYREGRYHAGYSETRSRTPGVVGAIIGGAIGHSVGNGKKNKKIGTAVGAILGGTIGSDISRRNHERARYERRGADRYRNVTYRTERVCEVVRDYRTEEHISGYDVSYAYGGQTYSTVLDHDPGRYLDVNVRVTPAE